MLTCWALIIIENSRMDPRVKMANQANEDQLEKTDHREHLEKLEIKEGKDMREETDIQGSQEMMRLEESLAYPADPDNAVTSEKLESLERLEIKQMTRHLNLGRRRW